MRLYIAVLAAPLALTLAACDPRAHDSTGAAAPPADAPVQAPAQTPAPNSAPSAVAAFGGEFKLAGTEPFWGLSIKGGQMILERSEDPRVAVARPAPVMDGSSAVWTSGALVVRLTPGDCSDGMSDRSYAYMATVKVGDVSLSGCGDRPEALAAQPG